MISLTGHVTSKILPIDRAFIGQKMLSLRSYKTIPVKKKDMMADYFVLVSTVCSHHFKNIADL